MGRAKTIYGAEEQGKEMRAGFPAADMFPAPHT